MQAALEEALVREPLLRPSPSPAPLPALPALPAAAAVLGGSSPPGDVLVEVVEVEEARPADYLRSSSLPSLVKSAWGVGRDCMDARDLT